MNEDLYVCVVVSSDAGQTFYDEKADMTYRTAISVWSSWEKADSHGLRTCLRIPGTIYAVDSFKVDEFEEKPYELN
jgi:hypothetical protein